MSNEPVHFDLSLRKSPSESKSGLRLRPGRENGDARLFGAGVSVNTDASCPRSVRPAASPETSPNWPDQSHMGRTYRSAPRPGAAMANCVYSPTFKCTARYRYTALTVVPKKLITANAITARDNFTRHAGIRSSEKPFPTDINWSRPIRM